MLLSTLLALSAVLAPSVSAALFPKDTVVKQIGPKEFKKAMKENRTAAVAFVAPWCGHCQRMAPEFSKAALGLYPLVPFYAVDCDKQANKGLCAEQGVKGFPTVKLFPRGAKAPAVEFDGGERSASAFFYWASRRIPHSVKKLYKGDDIPGWVNTDVDKPRALLMTKDKKIPVLWQTLSVKYGDRIQFANHRDKKGKTSVTMGMEAGERDESKVLIYPSGLKEYVRFEGLLKYDSLSKFFDSVLDGTADLTIANKEAAAEEYTPSDEEVEIQRKQEAQRIALAHGGFSDLIDFEKAVLDGAGSNFHDTNGFMMGGSMPYAKKKAEGDAAEAKEEDAVHKMLKAQKEAAKREQEEKEMPKTPAAATPSAADDATAPKAEATADASAPADGHTKDEL